MVTATDPTVLRLFGMGVHPYSARGLTQTLEPIDQAANLQRSVNGELIDLGYEPFQKYKSTISGNDVAPPACDGIWPGKIVEVDCIARLAFATLTGSPQRPVADYDEPVEEQGFTTYRPRLTMMVMSFSMEEDEWAANVGWKLELEEI